MYGILTINDHTVVRQGIRAIIENAHLKNNAELIHYAITHQFID